MKEIRNKNEFATFFLRNTSGKPEVVLIMPITRSEKVSKSKWAAVVSFVENSEIETLVIIDKTSDGSATRYFMENFNSPCQNLYVLPRSIGESHYESLGSIQLRENMWVMQLHDDDEWEGHVKLPKTIDPVAAYYSKFYIKNKSEKFIEEKDFSTPGRINFVLIPAHIWNKFALLVQDQKYHVAGSLDSTLSLMVRLTCKLLPIPDFAYYYDNHNWAGRVASRRSLLKLTKKDGWGVWATTDIALLSRLLDNLSCLSYVQEFAEAEAANLAFMNLMQQFDPRLRRKILIGIEILALKALTSIRVILPLGFKGIELQENLELKLSRALFIRDSWSIEDLPAVINLVRKLENRKQFPILQERFHFWHIALQTLTHEIGA